MTDQMDRRIDKAWWRRGPWPAVAGGVALAAVLAIGAMVALSSAHPSTRTPLANVTIETVRAGVFHDITTLQGKVVPKDIIYLDALEGGQVQKLLVQAGDRVTAGQPLIVFRNTQLELEVLDQEGRLVESITQLQAYERQLEQNRALNRQALETIDYNVLRLGRMAARREPLARVGYAPREQTEQIADELQHNRVLRPLQAETNDRQEALRRQQLPQIHAEMASLQQSLAITRGKLEDLTVKAPVTGRLTVMDLKIGQNRNRGERLAELTLDTGFKLSASVDEYYLGRVQNGQAAEVEIDGRTYPLVATRIYPQVANGVFTVDLAFTGAPPSGLLPGQAVQGRLALGADRRGLVLPAGPFLERTGGDWAFVLSPDGRHAERRRIKVGRRNAEQVEILAGLRPGERVITSDYQGWEKLDRIDLTK
jgi:HlyD family secretion protein